jgi:hypothetical protein
VVAGDDGELARLREGTQELRGALELARLRGEGQVARGDQVVDADLAERVEQPLREPGGVALAVSRGEAVPGVPAAVGDVEIGDVAEADDRGLR